MARVAGTGGAVGRADWRGGRHVGGMLGGRGADSAGLGSRVAEVAGDGCQWRLYGVGSRWCVGRVGVQGKEGAI